MTPERLAEFAQMIQAEETKVSKALAEVIAHEGKNQMLNLQWRMQEKALLITYRYFYRELMQSGLGEK